MMELAFLTITTKEDGNERPDHYSRVRQAAHENLPKVIRSEAENEQYINARSSLEQGRSQQKRRNWRT